MFLARFCSLTIKAHIVLGQKESFHRSNTKFSMPNLPCMHEIGMVSSWKHSQTTQRAKRDFPNINSKLWQFTWVTSLSSVPLYNPCLPDSVTVSRVCPGLPAWPKKRKALTVFFVPFGALGFTKNPNHKVDQKWTLTKEHTAKFTSVISNVEKLRPCPVLDPSFMTSCCRTTRWFSKPGTTAWPSPAVWRRSPRHKSTGNMTASR